MNDFKNVRFFEKIGSDRAFDQQRVTSNLEAKEVIRFDIDGMLVANHGGTSRCKLYGRRS